MFIAKSILLKTLTNLFSYINLVMWQDVVLCRSSVAKSVPLSVAEPTQYYMVPQNQICTGKSITECF